MGGLTLPFAGSLDTDGTVFGITQVASGGIAIAGGSYGTDQFGDTGIGVIGSSDAGTGVLGTSTNGAGVEGSADYSAGVYGYSFRSSGIWGESNADGNAGVVGINDATSPGQVGIGVYGKGVYGVQGEGETGVVGKAIGPGAGLGVWAMSDRGDALYATTGSGTAVHAHAVTGQAGYFQGDVNITGKLSKGGGGFRIDHPEDPANKYLSHSFVESPEMKNVYDGVVVMGAKGEAEVKLPPYFEALNRDFRYQLTPIGAAAPNLHIAKGLSRGRFRIAGGPPRMKVCWQVTGVRKDRWAEKHRVVVEEKKPAKHRGFYLHPELYGKPAKKQIEWARNPENMRRIEETAKGAGRRPVGPRPKRSALRSRPPGNPGQS